MAQQHVFGENTYIRFLKIVLRLEQVVNKITFIDSKKSFAFDHADAG